MSRMCRYLMVETMPILHQLSASPWPKNKKGIRVVLEHTSANPNGPLHVGHIRNSIIGDTLARVFRKAGYGLEVQYYVNDMGRQIAIVVWGFIHLDSTQ